LPTKILRLASLDTFNSPDKMKIEKMLKKIKKKIELVLQ
jgi:hypothetical protein